MYAPLYFNNDNNTMSSWTLPIIYYTTAAACTFVCDIVFPCNHRKSPPFHRATRFAAVVVVVVVIVISVVVPPLRAKRVSHDATAPRSCNKIIFLGFSKKYWSLSTYYVSSDRRFNFAVVLPAGIIGRIYAKRYYIDRINDINQMNKTRMCVGGRLPLTFRLGRYLLFIIRI